jgi:N6-L-threonylcarbamoyladenine synthase
MGRLILGIETSCDETAAAVYEEGVGSLSNELFSQIKIHEKFGGVVPEAASRSHLEKIGIIIQKALDIAQKTLDDIDVIAVTTKPGLPGSLLVGLCFSKAIALVKNKPIIGINHLEGHAFSSFLSGTPPFPHLCITASGGHTSMYIIKDFGEYETIGQTLDDAAGEAFDKIARLMDLPYPGGPVIEKLAAEVGFEDFFHYPRGNAKNLDFSFSGLKTAVFYDLVKRNMCDLTTKKFNASAPNAELIKKQVASSLLVCIKDMFQQKLTLALKNYPEAQAISFVGGVACNKFIRNSLSTFAQEHNRSLFVPEAQFCTDNGAMIAFVGSYKAKQGNYSDLLLDIF